MLKYDFEKNIAVIDCPSIWKIDKLKVSVTTVTDTSIVDIPNEGCVTIQVGNIESFGDNKGDTTSIHTPGTDTNESGSSTGEITYTPPTETDSTPAMGESDLLYTVGLISDMHYCVTADNRELISTKAGNTAASGSYFDEDLRHIIIDTFNYYNVDFIASPGDVATYDVNDFIKFTKDYTTSRPFYCAIGNHDHKIIYGTSDSIQTDQGTDGSRWYQVTGKNKSGVKNTWNCPGKLHENIPTSQKCNESYYVTKNNGNDIYIFLQSNFGEQNNQSLIHPHNQLSSSNTYVQQMINYCGINTFEDNESNFNFQYYLPEDLIWLKNIIESNTGKRIFVFSHYFLPNKAGGGNKYVPGASTELMGITFHFLNKLNNSYRNVTWFSGHSHYSWMDNSTKGLHWTNTNYDYIKPTAVDNATILTNPTNDYYKVTTGNKPYNRDSAKLVNNNKTGWNIHLPSMSRPVMSGSSQLPGCEAAVMFVYGWGVEIKKLGYTRNSNGTYTSYGSSIPDRTLIIYNDGTGECNDVAPEINETKDVDGITLVFNNLTGQDIRFAGKFSMYLQELNEKGENIEMHMALCAPNSEAGGYPHWAENPLQLKNGETMTFVFEKIDKYTGTGTKVIHVVEKPSKYYGKHFKLADGAVWPAGTPAIKFGVYSYGRNDGGSGTGSAMIHAIPIPESNCLIKKNGVYEIILDQIKNNATFDKSYIDIPYNESDQYKYVIL